MRAKVTGWLVDIVRKPGFWFILAVIVLLAIPHYSSIIAHPSFLSTLWDEIGLDRHAFERILFLAPIVWAGFVFGWKGAVLTSFVALAVMLPRAVAISAFPRDALFETGSVFIVGNLVALAFEALNRERERRVQLLALNQTSSAVSQYLELGQLLDASIDSVANVMKVNAALVFLMNEEATELKLAARKGISDSFASAIARLRVGEGFNGTVALNGEPFLVKDASRDPALTSPVVCEEGIRSQLIVPLMSKSRVMGTLCVATHALRKFKRDEIELLRAVGNQIGVAVENARLYDQERSVAEQLRQSEEKYRQLFEDAHDAIWLHDVRGRILSANKSFMRLTGYSRDELADLKFDSLVSPANGTAVGELRSSVLKGEATGQLSEVTLVRKNLSERIVQLSTSPVFRDGQVEAFQQIARDVTDEKRMRENLQFYLQQVTRAQEEERKRIARELHDDTIQALVVLSRQLDDLASRGEGLSREEKEILERLWQKTNGIMEGLRRLSQDLRPATLDRLGLLPAVEWLASDVEKLSGINVQVAVTGPPRRMVPEAELLMFRIVQEALRNVWRHSGATSASVKIEFGESSTALTIADDGRGFDLQAPAGSLPKEGKLGLAGMEERARLLGGMLTVNSSPGRGVTIHVQAPI